MGRLTHDRKSLAFAVGATVLLLSAPAVAAPMMIDFEADLFGLKPNGYSPVGFPAVTFTDTSGAGLQIANFGSQSGGTQALAVFSDTDGSGVNISFGTTLDAITLAFGNDDPSYSNPGDLALLQAFLGGGLVGQTTVVLNRDDIMNQTISFAGLFDQVFFAYTDPNLNPFTGGGNTNTGLTEVIDNITFTEAAVAVPEPSALGLLGAGLVGLGAFARRRRMTA